MAHEFWFWVGLKCRDCGEEISPQQTQLEANGLNPELHGRSVHPGEVMPVEVDEFGISFTALRRPGEDGVLRVLIGWACPFQATGQWARVYFTVLPEGVRFDAAQCVDVTPELADDHFVDNCLPRMIEAMPAGPERDALRAALGDTYVMHR